MILAQTPWAYPTNISQITESDAHVAWDSAGLSYIRYDDANLKYIYICSTCDTTWKTDDSK